MAGRLRWKRTWPLVLAMILIAGLAATTVWMRNPGTTLSAAGARDATNAVKPDARVDEGDAFAPRALRQNQATAPSAAQVQQQVKSSLARRARLRDQQARDAATSKQQALATYRAEKIDRVWAAQKETELSGIATSAALVETKIAPTAFDVTCKRTMCRLTGRFSTNSEAEDWTLYYMSSVGSALPNSVVSRTQNPDATTSVEIYGRAR